MCDEARKVAC